MVHTHLRGARQGEQSSSTNQARRGPRARAGNPGLRAILAQKKRPETLVSWAADGERGSVASAQPTERQVCGAYSLLLAATASQAAALEIVLDASRFGGQDTELGVAFSSCVGETGGGLAGYLPPARKRELAWRAEESGAPLNEKDKAKLAKDGFRPAPGMKSYDYAKVFSHFLRCLRCSYSDFKAEPMPRLRAGEIRWWESGRWW